MGTVHVEPRLEKRTFARGREIFAQGEAGDCAYLVDCGAVTIYQRTDGRRIELGTIRAGEIFGEMAAIDGGPRMASAVAAERTVLTRIPKEMFDRKIGGADKFVRGILNFFIRSIRATHENFLRRPRSIGDHLRMMEELNGQLHAFARWARGDDGAEALCRALSDLDLAVLAVGRAASLCKDNRHDLIVEDEDEGGRFAAAEPLRPNA